MINKIGKHIHGQVYIHMSYIQTLPSEGLERILEAKAIATNAGHDLSQANLVRYNTKTGNVAFIECPDFDISQEPLPTRYINVRQDGSIKIVKGTQILHHKWMMVGADYMGFDISDSQWRSESWTAALCHIDRKRIGNPKYWDSLLKSYGLEPRIS